MTPVMTVAPQKDIWLHGRTYPRNAVAIERSSKRVPVTQTLGWFPGELKYRPRIMWEYSKIKKREAPFMCMIRGSQPVSMSRMIIITEEKA